MAKEYYALISYRNGCSMGNVWEKGLLSECLQTTRKVFGVREVDELNLVDRKRVKTGPNPYGADSLEIITIVSRN